MTLMLVKLHDALLAGGVSQEKAQAAAEEVAAYDGRAATIDTRLSILNWMASFNLGLTFLLLAGGFMIWSELGEITARLSH